MNSFIFSYHPRGASLEGFLAAAGFEAWRVDLRAQGESKRVGGSDDFGLEDLATTDLGCAVRAVLERTHGRATHVDVLGASLGGTIVFLHTALTPAHKLGSIVAIGSPVRWVEIHPAIKLAFSSPWLAGSVRFRGTRKLAEVALPHLVRRVPWLLSVYMNPSITDTSAAREMVKTVEDPNRHINREIAEWIRRGDLVIHRVNVSDALLGLTRPLLCVLANGDGIVPRATAEFPYHQARSRSKALLEVGTNEIRMAHADLFVSNEAHARVFQPIVDFLAEQRLDDEDDDPPPASGSRGA
jgi:pimeloyl-ACP methyl ester carboxylesterase